MTSDQISISNARTHNLKNVSVDLPRNRLNVITGVSGSGKSSLAYDTIYAEGQRRYVESLSAYARQFLSVMEKPDVDSIDGLSPAVSINQQAARYNPRSTVGTLTEIYDYLRLLYARVGEPRCPEHGVRLAANTISQLVDFAMSIPEGSRIALLAPVVRHRKGEHEQIINQLRKEGFVRVRIDGIVYDAESVPKLERYANHTIEVVVDRVIIRDQVRTRLAESIETAVNLADGTIMLCGIDAEGRIEQTGETYSTKYGCPHCGFVLSELEPRIFSFNNPSGACKTCNGLGITSFMDPEKIVVAPEYSLAEGALAFWNPSYRYYYSILKSLAKQYDFSVDTPFNELPESITDIILYGSGTDSVKLRLYRPSGRSYRRTRPFEGVVNNFQRRYLETESDGIKEELAKYLTADTCADCNGSRLAPGPRNVFVDGKSIHEIIKLNVEQCLRHMSGLHVERQQAEIARRILLDIRQRLKFLASVGLTYVTLDRATSTLSGGELQRIRLASQIGSGLVGVTYVLDEPSIGLHERDQRKLLDTLFHLRDIGNTLVVVEHDETTIRSADFVVDLGPGAGKHGGELLVAGHHEEVAKTAGSITGQYLSGKRRIPVPGVRKSPNSELVLRIVGATGNNLKHIDVDIPLGLMTCITGVSGSGKSTLLNGTIYPALMKQLYRSKTVALPHERIVGTEHIDKAININQQPIGRTPRSNPATYTGLFTPIREQFSRTLEARARGYKPGRFSFNVAGGRCESCRGDGLVRVEMHFLPDIFVSCEACQGKRYNRETLEITYRGLNIAQVLELTIDEALEIFDAIPAVARRLRTLQNVGLGYLQLGQNALTLSGGEAQRVKLSLELSKRDTGKTLYILDEPTTGLHFEDIKQLLEVLFSLRDRGNTVLIIEHNMDIIKSSDWIIDLGPEGGEAGGEVVAAGTPEQVALVSTSETGKCLASRLDGAPQQQWQLRAV